MEAMTSPLEEDERGLPLGTRQSKSADIERELGLSGWDVTDDEELLRPATALASLSVPTKTAKPSSRGGGRRASITPVSTKHVQPNDGWGNPDTIVNHTNQEWEDSEGVVQPPQEDSDAVDATLQRRGLRIEALARHSGKPRTAYAKETPRRQVLHQRMLAVMQLAPPEAVPPDAAYSPLKSVLKKPLGISQHQRDCSGGDDARLPTITKSTVPSPSIVSRGTGLFGPHVEDSLEMREQLVQRFLPVWSLLPSRSKVTQDKLRDSDSRPSTRGSSPSDTVARDTKSPFECSMLLTKICKAVGISLAASPPPDVWRATAKQRSSTTAAAFATNKLPHSDVDLEAFSEFVVRNALQPAMHHFRLDRDATEYFLTLDAVVHSLVTRVDEPETQRISPWRLRELGELHPVLPLWKKGMQFAPKQPPLVKTSPTAAAFLSVGLTPGNTNEAATMVYSVALSGGDVGVVPPSEFGLSLQSKKLSAYEAKAMQDANIRRKMQLRNSWQPRIVVSEPLPQQQQALQPFHPATPFGRAADAAHGVSSSSLDDHSCIRGEGVLRPSSHDTLLTRPGISSNNQVSETLYSAPEDLPVDETPAPVLPLLLCGSCPGEQEASLWCSACFAVYCTACWTATHHSTVDLSAVENQHDQHLPAPTARPMRTQRDHLAPPVAMVYLPTKPVANGKLKRGSSMVLADTNQLDDVWTGSGDPPGEDPRLLTNALSSHTILPAIKPPRQKSGLSKYSIHHRSAPTLDPPAPPSAMDSTANLLKALMLGTASSASVLGSTTSLSPWSISSDTKPTTGTVRVSQEPTKRKKLHPKAVTLDANALIP